MIIKFQLIGAALLLLSITALSQNANLVPNPSFEEYIDCPDNPGQIWKVEPWMHTGSVDYYHECGTNGAGIPISWGGGGYANNGQAYIGLTLVYLSEFFPEFREYAGVSLTSSLISGKKYRIMFYVSFADSSWYASKNIGAHLSTGSLPQDINQILLLEPHVKYSGDEFLTYKEGWTRIEGEYLAQGGENYLTIGNFDSDTESETVYVEGGGVVQDWTPAYYFIDDISVIPVDSLVGIGEEEIEVINIYPNPAQEYFIVETDQSEGGTVRLVDMTGRQVAVSILPIAVGKWQVDIANIPPGIYLLEAHNKEGRKAVQKVLVQH